MFVLASCSNICIFCDKLGMGWQDPYSSPSIRGCCHFRSRSWSWSILSISRLGLPSGSFQGQARCNPGFPKEMMRSNLSGSFLFPREPWFYPLHSWLCLQRFGLHWNPLLWNQPDFHQLSIDHLRWKVHRRSSVFSWLPWFSCPFSYSLVLWRSSWSVSSLPRMRGLVGVGLSWCCPHCWHVRFRPV